MANGTSTGNITWEVVETEEQPFQATGRTLTAVLTPTSSEAAYEPPAAPSQTAMYGWPAVPTYTEEAKRPVIVDIETTGLNPWESRIICIAAMDPYDPDNVITFFDLDEKVMVEEFISWFNSSNYNQLIGYNVTFDHRFVFTTCMRYRIQCPKWADADLWDIMEVMQRVKREYVYGTNKSGSLDNWAQLLLNKKKALDFEGILLAWKQKRYEDIINYCVEDVNMEAELFALILFTKGLA